MGDRGDRGELGTGLPQDDRPAEAASDFDFDLASVHADDEYLDLLGGASLEDPNGAPDDQLSALLMAWRQDVETEPIGELVDEKLATVTVQAARMRRKRRPRLLVPVAAAAAVLAIGFAGMGLAAQNAQPGDTLWALTKVLYADHARSVEAAEAVRADLREAKAALTEGNLDEAKSKLEAAHAALPTVSKDEGKAELEKQHRQLVAQLPGSPSGEATSPPQPNPSTAPDNSGTGANPGSGTGSGDPQPSTPPTTTEPPPTTDTPPTTTVTPPTSETPRSETGTGVPAGDPAAAPLGAQSLPGNTATVPAG